MKILIVGGSGLVGGNLSVFVKNNHPLWEQISTHRTYGTPTTIHFNPCDLTNWPVEITNSCFDYVIHTGALTNVDKCEEEVDLSYHQTVISTKHLVKFVKRIKSKIIYISTDYVFNGDNGPYKEDDNVDPLCIYGKHKLMCEEYIQQQINPSDFLILRITNVYGDEPRGKNYVSRTTDQIREGKLNFSAPYDQFATPINANDVARCICLLIEDKKAGFYHLASTDYVSRVQLLQRISKEMSCTIQIKAVSTKELNQRAQRPLLGGLLASKFLNEYPFFSFTNISDYIKSKIY